MLVSGWRSFNGYLMSCELGKGFISVSTFSGVCLIVCLLVCFLCLLYLIRGPQSGCRA